MNDSSTQNEDAPIDRRSADIGIVCTQNLEIKPLLKKLDRARKYVDDDLIFRGGFLEESVRVAVVEAGAGFARHRLAAQTLINEHHPAWVLAIGFSSPLNDDLKPGDICLANEIADTHGNLLPVKCSIPESKRIYVRKHVVADRHPGSASERKQLAESTNAEVADTTSLAVAQACAESSTDDKPATRFMSIRGIVGETAVDLEQDVTDYLFSPEAAKKGGGLVQLWSRIRPDKKFAPWKTEAEQTAVNLTRFVLGVIDQLAQKLGRY